MRWILVLFLVPVFSFASDNKTNRKSPQFHPFSRDVVNVGGTKPRRKVVWTVRFCADGKETATRDGLKAADQIVSDGLCGEKSSHCKASEWLTGAKSDECKFVFSCELYNCKEGLFTKADTEKDEETGKGSKLCSVERYRYDETLQLCVLRPIPKATVPNFVPRPDLLGPAGDAS